MFKVHQNHIICFLQFARAQQDDLRLFSVYDIGYNRICFHYWRARTPIEAADDMQLFWDYDDSTINPDEEMKITLTLVVSSNIQDIDTFAFDIVLVGAAT